MRRRFALLIVMFTLTACQSSRAQTEGSTRLSKPTLTSPKPVVQPRHPTDAPRCHYYDPL